MKNKKDQAKKKILDLISEDGLFCKDARELAESLDNARYDLDTFNQAVIELEGEGRVKITYTNGRKFLELADLRKK